MVIVMGDFNVKIGAGKDGKALGSFGLGTRIKKGHRLVEFCQEFKMSISYTHFQHKPRHLYTWKSPGDICRNQIDFIMVKERFRNCIIDVNTFPGADINSDHCLLGAKMRVKVKVPQKPKQQVQGLCVV